MLLRLAESRTRGDGDGATVSDGGAHDARPSPACSARPDDLDVLFVVENAGSIVEEQASLVEQLPRVVRALATGDFDADGSPEAEAFTSVHYGVVSTDMGTGGNDLPSCLEPTFGDDGVLRDRGNTALAGCMTTYPSFLTFEPDDDVVTFGRSLQCVAQLGTGGCAFEQPLEAALKAVTPSTSPITFFGETAGHADGLNLGFVRPDSLLAIVILAEENDCSVLDPDLLDPASTVYGGDIALRCFTYPAALRPIDRYVDGLLALRPAAPDRLAFAVIGGVPTDLVGSSYDAMLADARMEERLDPSMPTRLSPSCNVPGRGTAEPPRRLVLVAKGLEERGAKTIAESMCQADFTDPVTSILRTIALPRPECR